MPAIRVFKLVDLSRNFGFQSALAAGVAAAATADAVVTMDADLQDPPEVLPELVARGQRRRGGRAVRRTRSESGLRRLGLIFFTKFGALIDYPSNPTPARRSAGRAAVERSTSCPNGTVFFPGLRAWVGFARVDVLYDRRSGPPASRSRLSAGWCATRSTASSVSYLPLRVLTYAGVFIAFMGFGRRPVFILWG